MIGVEILCALGRGWRWAVKREVEDEEDKSIALVRTVLLLHISVQVNVKYILFCHETVILSGSVNEAFLPCSYHLMLIELNILQPQFSHLQNPTLQDFFQGFHEKLHGRTLAGIF